MIAGDEATARICNKMSLSGNLLLRAKLKTWKPSSTKWVDRHSYMVSPPARRLLWKQQSSSVTRLRNSQCMRRHTTMMTPDDKHGGSTQKSLASYWQRVATVMPLDIS